MSSHAKLHHIETNFLYPARSAVACHLMLCSWLCLPAVANTCRDEITCGLKYKIEEAFPLVFNINGLGGGITAGVIGFGAGLSHSPKSVVSEVH